MNRMTWAACLLAVGVSGCSTPSASGDQKLTVEECRSYFEHTYRLDGMDIAKMMGEEGLQNDAKTCSEYGSVTRRHFDCAMAATSVDALQSCGTPNT